MENHGNKTEILSRFEQNEAVVKFQVTTSQLQTRGVAAVASLRVWQHGGLVPCNVRGAQGGGVLRLGNDEI